MSDLPSRPRVFLDVQSGPEHFGRIVIELFTDKAPKTCENFRAICTSSYTPPSATKAVTYKLSRFHRIIDEFMIQGGDITSGDGTGGISIYGSEFEDENIGWREIDKEGLVCMANRGKGTNSSQFFITLAPSTHLNTKHTVFGHLISGLDVLHRMAKVRVDTKDRPLTEILISHCGELERRTRKAAVSPSKPHPSTTRGRKRPTTRSPSTSRSPSPPNYYNKRSIPTSRPPRRKSDIALDETRRGRTLTRSPSPHALSPAPPVKRRKRNLPPSRERESEKGSRSPHMRRRYSGNRERGLGREKQDRREGAYEGRRDRYVKGRHGGGYRGRERGDRRDGERHDGYDTAGRLDGPGDSGGNIKFKGRGSMKYREKNW